MQNFPIDPEDQQELLGWLDRLSTGDYSLPDRADASPNSALESGLSALTAALKQMDGEYQQVMRIAGLIEQGLTLEDVLEQVYAQLPAVIPFNRIGFSLIDHETGEVIAYWAKGAAPELWITKGYSAPLAGSSLADLIETRQPRILNDLESYLAAHPASDSTRRIVEEGQRSSLTCPLILNGEPIGFLFFSSRQKNTYENVHVHIFQLIASQIASVLERGRLVSQLAERNEELIRVSKMKNVFLSMASHDLRSPLAFIKMVTSVFLDPEMEITEEQRLYFLHDMSSQADHMLTLISNLLDITRLESGTLTIVKEAIDLPTFMTAVVDSQNRLAVYKQTTVRLLTSKVGTLAADSTLLRQALNNLITNAVKFSPPASVIDVWYERSGDGWRISIKDQGPGIQPEERYKLFQYFTRLSAHPTADESSHGLGLAISQQIMQAHGGVIDVESTPGEGSVFFIELPDSE